MFKNSSKLGSRGEKAAVEFLKKNNYKILETNFCNTSGRRLGEIDVIAKDKEELVFIEVKTRKMSTENILPEENITRDKLYKLNKAAAFYISKHKLFDCSYRFDAITLLANPDKNSAQLRHLKNIFY